jgi:hypothetical protein
MEQRRDSASQECTTSADHPEPGRSHTTDSALTPFHRILLMTLYAPGVRRETGSTEDHRY